MYNYKEIEPKILKFWRKVKLLKKLEEKNKKGKSYFFLDGPPYANFVPHVGHIRNTVYKDLNVRLAFMKGNNVLFQPGFDTHGLPVENSVEKQLNLKSKKDIEKLGVAKFMNICKNSAATNKDLWMEVYDKLGSWYSWKEPYMTYENSYIESGWWTFKKIWDKGMVYEGKKSVFWCPKCMTALAGYEVTDSYVMLRDPSIYIKFKVKDKDEYLLVYTTTPWTLISNVAIAAHPDQVYVKVNTNKGRLILAKERLVVLEELNINYNILEEFKGRDLDGLSYESVIDVPMQTELSKNPKAHKVIMSIPILKERVSSKLLTKKKTQGSDVFEDFVTVVEGTGLVHTAPGHGKTDNEVGKHYDLPEASPLDDEAKYTDMAGQFQGMFVKDADANILEVLEKTGNLLHQSKKEHKYPVCWRCKSPLIFRMSNQWFIKIDQIKQRMLEFNEKINWMPEFARERFETWILNAEDWNISRQRYWGIPIPIWKCRCGNLKVIDSFDDLKGHSRAKFGKTYDLHTVDNIKLWCEKCKENKMERIRDIFDVWFDSGIAPWAAFGYPFENKKMFEEHFPVSRINESQDQIRGWFYHLMFCGVAVFGKAPFESVSMPGWVVDDKGEKMSKSLGNVVYAKESIEDFGADSLRFYYVWDIAPYELQKFNINTLKKEIHRILNILWNIHIYLINQTGKISKASITKLEDKWILSKLNSLIKDCNIALDKFEYHEVGRKIADFVVNNLSREYIQFVRERVDNNDETVFYAIHECLSKVILLLAPICPFISEEIYRNLKNRFKNKEISIHLERWPKEENKLINKGLEEDMEMAKEVIQKILSEREAVKLGVRWPIKEAVIKADDENAIKKLKDVIMRQTNVKAIDVKKGKLSVKLDTEMTPKLEKEGFARELMRKVQDMRKKAGLKKGDKIELVIESEYNIKLWENEIKNKVGAKKIFYERQKDHKNLVTEDIKGKTFNLSFVKVK